MALAYVASLPVSMTATEGIFIAGMVVWLCLAIFRGWGKTLPPLSLPLLGLAGAATISGAFNGGAGEALASLWSLKMICTYFWSYHLFAENRRLLFWCVLTLLLVSSVAGIWGTIQQLCDIHPGPFKYLQGTGFLSGPMQFAGQMQIFALVATGLFATGSYKQLPPGAKVVLALLTLANWLGVIFAGERSAWLGALCGSLALAACVSWRTLLVGMSAAGLVTSLAYFCIPMVHVRLNAFAAGRKDVSVSVRLRLWSKALELWRESPVVGCGWRKFPHLDIKEAIVPGVSKDINHAHSNYFQVLATSGIIGCLSYIWLFVCAIATAGKIYWHKRAAGNRPESGLALGALASTVSLMVAGLFEYNFGTAQVRLAQWFVLGMLSKK